MSRLRPTLCGLIVAAMATALVENALASGGFTSDFDQLWVAGRALLHGTDPYVAVAQAHINLGYPLYYPLPAVVLTLPFTLLPLNAARVAFGAACGFLTGYGLQRLGLFALLAVASTLFQSAIIQGQMTPALAGAAMVPTLGFLLVAKPTVGLALWISRPSRRAAIGAIGLLALTVVLWPWWPREWLAAIQVAPHIRPPIMRPAGILLLLGALRWRRPEGRLLAAWAFMPHTGGAVRPHADLSGRGLGSGRAGARRLQLGGPAGPRHDPAHRRRPAGEDRGPVAHHARAGLHPGADPGARPPEHGAARSPGTGRASFAPARRALDYDSLTSSADGRASHRVPPGWAAVAVAAAAGIVCWLSFRVPPVTSSDFDQLHIAARALLAGTDPYAAVAARQPFPLLYPLPAVLVAVPFAWLPLEIARAFWAALGAGASPRGPALRKRPAGGAAECAVPERRRTGSVVTAPDRGRCLPPARLGLGIEALVGAALFLAYPSRRAALSGIAIVGLSLVVMPAWPRVWWAALHQSLQRAPILEPGGFLLALALLRWRAREARLLLALACVPQTIGLYELLPLFLIPRRRREGYILAILTYAAAFGAMLVFPGVPASRSKPPCCDAGRCSWRWRISPPSCWCFARGTAPAPSSVDRLDGARPTPDAADAQGRPVA